LTSFYPNDAHEAIVAAYDLRDPDAWERAGRERRAWGRERTVVHALDDDHVVIEFMPGGARELSA
jgi:hypothetical protein